MTGPNCIEAQECRGDFWLKLKEAIELAGGNSNLEGLPELPLKEVVNILAQNGIRMTYREEWHINNIKNLVS